MSQQRASEHSHIAYVFACDTSRVDGRRRIGGGRFYGCRAQWFLFMSARTSYHRRPDVRVRETGNCEVRCHTMHCYCTVCLFCSHAAERLSETSDQRGFGECK